MRGANNENTFIIVDGNGKALAEVSDKFAGKYKLKFPFVYLRPSDYLPTLNLTTGC